MTPTTRSTRSRRATRAVGALAAGLPLALGLAGTAVVLGSTPAGAATVVDEQADEMNADGDCSLREAVEAVRLGVPVDACAVPADGTVFLGEGVHSLGDGLEIDATVKLRGVGRDDTAIDCSGLAGGACLRTTGSGDELHLVDLAVGMGPAATVLADPGVALVRLERAAVVGGTAGIVTDDADVEMVDAYAAVADTHGISTVSGDVSLVRSVAMINDQSGIVTDSGAVTVEAAAVFGNQEFGIATRSGDVLVRNVTIAGNAWDAVRTVDGHLRYESTTVVGNRRALNITGSGTATFDHTLLAEQDLQNCDNPVLSAGYNLSDDLTCDLTAEGDQVGVDPLLTGPFGEDDGFPSVGFDRSGPAADVGGSCPATDQRGAARPTDTDGDGVAACDVGAVELAGPAAPPAGDPTGEPGDGEPGGQPDGSADGGSDPANGSGGTGNRPAGRSTAPAAVVVETDPTFTG